MTEANLIVLLDHQGYTVMKYAERRSAYRQASPITFRIWLFFAVLRKYSRIDVDMNALVFSSRATPLSSPSPPEPGYPRRSQQHLVLHPGTVPDALSC